MAIRQIVYAPNKILSKPASPVNFPFTEKIRTIINDMKETVVAENGIGIAAPQIGEELRIIVINHTDNPFAIINPEITWSSPGTSALEEGCLSVPNTFIKVVRPRKVVVTGLDESGSKIEIKAGDMLAKIFQHEIDHINGILISDYAKKRILL